VHGANRPRRGFVALVVGLATVLLAVVGCGANSGSSTQGPVDTAAAASQAGAAKSAAADVAASVAADPGGKQVLDALRACEPLDKGGLDVFLSPADSLNDWRKRATVAHALLDQDTRAKLYDCVGTKLNMTEDQKAKFKDLAEQALYTRATVDLKLKSISGIFRLKKEQVKAALVAYLTVDLPNAYDVSVGLKKAMPTAATGKPKAGATPKPTPAPTTSNG